MQEILLLGDYFCDFPWPNAVLDRVRALPCAHVIAGNKEDALRRLLARPDVCGYLSCLDYDPGAGHRALLRQLSRRLCLEREFPHEIGIFLGYPLADVQGFIQNKGRNYTCCGCWKSYGDPRIARRRFNRYRVCTAVYKRRYAGGTPITQLIKAA